LFPLEPPAHRCDADAEMARNRSHGVAGRLGLPDCLVGAGVEKPVERRRRRCPGEHVAGDVRLKERLHRRPAADRRVARPPVGRRIAAQARLHRVHREVPNDTAKLLVAGDQLRPETSLEHVAVKVVCRVEPCRIALVQPFHPS
jgi:hypothetical protein